MSSYIEYHKFPRRETCTEEGCRARKWYIEDGRKFCQRGHEQSGFAQTQHDDEDWNIKQGKTTRRKGGETDEGPAPLSGREARELFLQCYQLILWKQCFWLVNVKGFPKELETVVRDLWGLRLGLVHGDKAAGSERYSSMGFSSMSEGETTDSDGRSLVSSRSRRSDIDKESLPKLVETLALCYIATLLMRLPTSIGEFHSWVAREEMVFSRAIKEIPKEMRARLPGSLHSRLEVREPLKATALQYTISNLVKYYHFNFEMVCPPLNFPPLIYKHMRNLALPIEIYPAVRQLAVMLEIDFSYPITDKRRFVVSYPEVQLMSLVVIATKLSHPFDSVVSYPESDADPTTMKMDWTKWREIMIRKPEDGLKRGDEVYVDDTQVADMSDKQMDQYLDWYQRTWIDGAEHKMPLKILEHFPLQDLPPLPAEPDDREERASRLKEVQGNLIVQRPVPIQDDDEDGDAEPVTRPGQFYRRYRNIDELPDDARAFYEVAATEAGTSLEELSRAVFLTEVMVQDWTVSERRKQLAREIAEKG